MKKLFTLLGAVLMATTSFGQTNWKNIVTNGDCEADVPAYTDYTTMPADAWNSFWYQYGNEGTAAKGTAEIVSGVGVDGSRCVKVVTRTKAEGEAAGNQPIDGGEAKFVSWDSQFFIYCTEPMLQGKEVRLTMYVKADKEQEIETQAHWGPGDYNHYQLFGNVAVTTEWKKVVLEATVSADHAKEADGKFFQSIAFNMAKLEDGNAIYFDNIKVQMRDPKTDDGSDAGAWINFMRKGIYSMDNIKGVGIVNENNKDYERRFECTNYTLQDLNKPAGEQQWPADVVEVPGEPGLMAVHIPVKGYKVVEVEDLDDEGNQQFDDEGNVKMKSIYYWNNGDSIGTSAPARWTCQFFVSTLHKMVPGEKYRFKFRCKADKETSLGTQCHYGPGQYAAYNTFGDESAFPITTDWKTFELGDFESVTDASKKVIPSSVPKPKDSADFPGEKIGCQTITFDCVPLEGEDNNFYLIVDEFSFTEKYVLDADRTLGTPEDIALPVSAGDDEKAVQIDAAPMLNTFEVEDFSFLNNGKDGIKLYLVKEPDDPEDDPIESFSSILPWVDGGFVGANGQVIDGDNGINIRFDDESIDGTKINLCTWNNLDSKNIFADGNTVKTKLAVSQSGWYYVYNITLMSEETYAGIKDVELVKKNNNVIYDLMGRKVSQPSKGLYIVNGKKYFIK